MPNEYDAIVGEDISEAKGSEFDAIVEETDEERRIRLEQSLRVGAQKNPDNQAKVIDLSERTGLTPDVVELKQAEVESRIQQRNNDYDFLFEEAPSTAQLLSDPNMAGVAHDDVDNLANTERAVRSPLSFRDRLGAAGKKGLAVVESSEIGLARMLSVLNLGPEVDQKRIARLSEIEHFMEFEDESGFFGGIPTAVFEQLPILGAILAEAGKVGVATGGVAALATGIVTKNPALTGKAFAFGFGVGAKVGTFGGAFELEAGLAFNEFTAADEHGRQLDEESAAAGAVMVGFVNAALESFSLRLLGKTFKGAKPLIRKQVRQALTTKTGRDIAKKVLSAYMASVAGEGITEAMQELSNIIGDNLLKALDGDDFDEFKFKNAVDGIFSQETLERAGGAGRVGLQAATGLGIPGSVVSASVQGARTQSASESEQETLDTVIENAQESKVRERAPTIYAQLIKDAVEDAGTVSDVYLTATEVQAFLESEGVDLSAETQDNPAIEAMVKQLPEALAGETDVVIPLEDFATYVTPSESFESIRPHIKLSAETLTQDQLSNSDKNLQDRVKELMEEAQNNLEVLRQAEVVFEDVKDQLLDTATMTPEAAATAAEIIPAYVTTKAVRTGLSVEEVYQRIGLKIVGPESATLEGGQEQLIGPEALQAKRLEKLNQERELLLETSTQAVFEGGETKRFLRTLSQKRGDLAEIDIDDDAALTERLSELLRDIGGALPRNAEFRFDELTGNIVQRGEDKATPEGLLEQVRALQARLPELDKTTSEFAEKNQDIDRRIDASFSGPTVFKQEIEDDLFTQLEAEIDFADEEVPNLTARGSVGFREIVVLLGQALYNDIPKMNEVVIKELVQNAFDAIKARIESEGFKGGKIEIEVDYFDRTITVRDNGIGMDLKTLQGPFFTIAQSKKEGTRDTGGFGIAKTLFLFSSDGVAVETVRDGTRLSFDATNQELLASGDENGKPIQIREETVGSDVSNGTSVTVKIPETYIEIDFGEETERTLSGPMTSHAKRVLEFSPLLEDIEVTLTDESLTPVETLEIGKSFDSSKFSSIGSLEFSWGQADLLISKEPRESGSYGSNMHILINGLWQVDQNVKISPLSPMSPQVPRTFYLNLRPTSKPESSDYPMDLNRQGIRKFASKDINQLKFYLARVFGVDELISRTASFGSTRQIDASGFTPPIDMRPPDNDIERLSFNFGEGDSVTISDGQMQLDGEDLPKLTKDSFRTLGVDPKDFRVEEGLIDPSLPVIHSGVVRISDGKPLIDILIDEFGDERVAAYLIGLTEVFKSLRDSVSQIADPEFNNIKEVPIGTSFDKAARDFDGPGLVMGINTTVPLRAMLLNPAQTLADKRTTDAFPLMVKVSPENMNRQRAADMLLTMIHEMAHHTQRNHYESFGKALQHLTSVLVAGRDLSAIVNDLAAHLGENNDIYEFANRKLWDGSYGNPGNTLDSVGTSESEDISRTPKADVDTGGVASTGTAASGQDVGAAEGTQDTGELSESGETAESIAAPGSVNPNAGDGSVLNKVFRQDRRGEIAFNEDATGAVIRLTEAANLSTFLHESGHLFLEMEKRFFLDPSISDEAKADGQAILDWLGVDSFDDIEDKHHEKWAVGFEAYLFEGNAPSAELKPVFRRFTAWLGKVYEGLRTLQVPLTPEIRGVMDRLLATDEQIAEVKAGMALEPLFKTAEEANMTPKEFGAYQEKTQGAAEEELRKKVLAQLRRTAQKWWRKELAAVQDEVRDELSARELYRAIAFMRAKNPPEGFEENKLDRDAVYALLGLAIPTEVQSAKQGVDPAIDSLSVAIAKLGGLDREEAEAQGVDSAHWRNIKKTKMRADENGVMRPVQVSVPNPDNLPVGVGSPLFRAKGGRTFDEMRELLAEEGMGYLDGETTASDLLDKLLDDLSGDTQYSKLADLDQLFENPNDVPAERFKAPAQLRGLTKKGGMNPDSLAEIFGFASGDELVRQIMESPTLNFAVERRANEIMVERHGDILNDGTLEREATEAAHNTEQGSALLAELRALSGQTNVQAVSERRTIRDAAARIIGGKRVSSLRPSQYHAAEVRAAQEAQKAKDAGDLEAAQAAKQKQVFHFHLWRAATDAIESASKMQKRLRTMQTKRYPAAAVRPDYVSQLRQFLSAYDFRRSNAQARKNGQQLLEATKKWIRTQQADPESPANIIDAEQLTVIVHYRDMTLDQLQAVHDIASSLLNAGRLNSKAEKEQFNEQMRIMAEHMAEVAPTKKELSIEDTKARRKTQWSRAVFAYHRKLESFVRELDGFEDLGPFWKLVIKPLLAANNRKLKMQENAHDALDVIFQGHEGIFNQNKDKRTFTLESGREIQLSLGGRIAMLLNWGNEGNREATMNQHDLAMTRADVETIIATLSDSDLDLAQDIWDYIDTFWDEIAKQERAITGIVPTKVEATEFEVNGRTMKGGYYPLVEDIARGRFTESDAQREARQAREKIGGTSHAATTHGWTIERRNFAGKSIDLNIDVVFNHVDAVIHDLSHRKAVMDVDRVLSNKHIADAIKAALGRQAHKSMKNTVVEVAGGHVNSRELSAVQSTLRWARLAVTYGALGFSLKTGFSQMLGFATAIGEFGGRDVVMRGVVDYLRDPVANRAFIDENSVFMRERGKTMHRDVTDIMQGLKGSTTMNTLRKKAFLFLLAGDRTISLPVWWGQYQVGMDRVADPDFEAFTTEQDAIDWADRSVSRTQQSGLLMDLANIESKNEFIKMWTVMYSAFSAIYQIAVEQGKKANLGKISRVEHVYNVMWILLIPPLFEELMTGRRDDDDEDSSAINNRWTKSVAGFSLGLMAGLREVGWLMETGRSSELPMKRVLKVPFDLGTQLEQFEIDDAFIRAAFAVPQLFLIPGGSQLTRSAQYLLALEAGDEEGFDVWEFLVTGPREETDEQRRQRENEL